MLDDKTVDCIGILNKKLTRLEKRVYELAKKEHQKVLKRVLEKVDGICDYELELEITFYSDCEEVFTYHDSLKPLFLLDRKVSNLNDNKDHNVTRGIYLHPILNVQKHCWLLHSMYDDYLSHYTWEEILKIDRALIDIHVYYQYEESLK